MNTYLDCYPCFLRQALEAARAAGASEDTQFRVVHKVLDEIGKFDPQNSPPEMAGRIHAIVRREAKRKDPYRDKKRESTEQSVTLYPKLKDLVDDPDQDWQKAHVKWYGGIMKQYFQLEQRTKHWK